MRSLFIRIGVMASALAICTPVATKTLWAQSTAEIFARLDDAARSFTAATANIKVITHTAVIDKDETQVGTIVVKRTSRRDERFLINFTEPDARAVAFRDGKIQLYYPKLNTVQEYEIGKYKDAAEKLILLGFGERGSELAGNYEVANLGNERIGSEDSLHLQLTPKAPEVLEKLKRVDLWISLKTNCPAQQKFYIPGGDYRLVTYSNFKVNPPHLPASALEVPKGAKRQRMN
jgi:outer membrane lipoprotein-sorting protein